MKRYPQIPMPSGIDRQSPLNECTLQVLFIRNHKCIQMVMYFKNSPHFISFLSFSAIGPVFNRDNMTGKHIITSSETGIAIIVLVFQGKIYLCLRFLVAEQQSRWASFLCITPPKRYYHLPFFNLPGLQKPGRNHFPKNSY